MFEAINVCHDLWTQETDNILLSESAICYDNQADVDCDYHEKNNPMEEMKNINDDSDEDEDAFGAKSQKDLVQV